MVKDVPKEIAMYIEFNKDDKRSLWYTVTNIHHKELVDWISKPANLLAFANYWIAESEMKR